MAQDFPQPRRRDGEAPCRECHLQMGEVCDICGAVRLERSAEHEFDCSECGRHIICFGWLDPARLCAACLTLPGWFRDPDLRACIDPEHDGRGADA